MKSTLLASAAILSCAYATAAQAQTPQDPGFNTGDFVVRVGAGAVLPTDTGSAVGVIGGSVHATDSVSPEVDMSYWFSEHFAAQLIAASTRHDLYVTGSALGRLDLGSTYVLPPALTIQYHPFPHEPFSPYVGLGLDMAFFYNTNPNTMTLDGTRVIDKIRLSTAAGPVFEAGLDYNIYGPFFINVDYKFMLLRTDAHIHALGNAVIINAHDDLNPSVPSIGIEYKF